MKIMIKSLFTYCDNISKRPKRKVVLALHCSFFPPAPPPTEWHWAGINHRTCSVDGGNSLTAEEHWAEDSCLFMNPGTGRGEKERLEVEKTGEVYLGLLSPVRRSQWRCPNIAIAKVPLRRRPLDGGARAGKADMNMSLVAIGGPSPWLQLPSKTVWGGQLSVIKPM